ncbi:MAG TPA: DUF4124 domain-containing protein [Dongiaceae bacterium]|nr:DUF4124 domain-containing protein [Dongiaceae bacterium]
MKTYRSLIVAAALTSFCFLTDAQAAGKYYKWVDSAGVVHYGENPPDPSKAQRVNVHTGVPTSNQPASEEDLQKKQDKLMGDAEKEKGKQEAKTAGEENAKVVEENCKIYQQNLSALKNSARIREKDEKGEYRYLTDEEKGERTKAAETYIKDNCKPS